MTYEYATWLASVLRDAGLEVVEHPGWRTRGLGEYRPFKVEHVVWHHDASAPGDSPGVPDFMIRNMASAGAQVWVDRKGRWHLIAAGRMPHAGSTRNGVVNENSLGIETDHTTGEDWPAELLASLRTGTAAILRHIGGTAGKNLHFHKSVCYPAGRKVDPDGLGLRAERRRVRKQVRALNKPVVKEPKHKLPGVSLRNVQVAAGSAAWARRIPRTDADVQRVTEALSAEGHATYAAYQRSLGYTGEDANGVPGRSTLAALGRRNGFRIVK